MQFSYAQLLFQVRLEITLQKGAMLMSGFTCSVDYLVFLALSCLDNRSFNVVVTCALGFPFLTNEKKL